MAFLRGYTPQIYIYIYIFQIMPECRQLKEISLYFYEVTQTRELPYCFECMITLIKVDKFPNEKFETTLPFFSGRLSEVLLPADSMRTDGFSFTAHFRSLLYVFH